MRWIVPFSFILLLQMACAHKNTEHSKEAAQTQATQTMQATLETGSSNERRVAVSVSDDTAQPFVINEPVPPSRLVEPGQKIRWTFLNNSASKNIVSVTIDKFQSGDDDSICADGTKDFHFGTIPKGEERSLVGCVVKEPDTMPKSYKYNISVCGASPPCALLDPIIVITR